MQSYIPRQFSYLSAYVWDLFSTELINKVKPNINSVEVHPQSSDKGHPVDSARVGAGAVWPHVPYYLQS
jgi:hypothetical protein